MAMEMHVFSERRLNSMAEWQHAVDLAGYALKFAIDTRLETISGFLPCRIGDRETGFECYHDDAPRAMEDYGRDCISRQWKYALGFRWRGDLTELQAAWIAAAAYAQATNGIVFDPEVARSYSAREAMKVVSDNERAMPDIEAAMRAAIARLTKKA